MQLFDIPDRCGHRPSTSAAPPHQQLSQTAPFHLQQELYRQCCALAGTVAHPSLVSVPGARALSMPDAASRGEFMVRREFFHLHPSYDGSMHLSLPPRAARVVVERGWGEPHPIAGIHLPAGTVLLYGPRDRSEVDICLIVVQYSASHLRGEIDARAGR
ncbi:luciferase domain-containing protein [Amycolatopsis vastitatis]|uniref:Phospholipase n=1 Tax=Amycolatopsis vastitatis TaxID=1905142 RepID=A0A229TBX4_9PSEU|nr:luciferase family protein [Amycolatopsis vastitatis]OXM68490.1 phospholipase [Amycolatopsis vastitatis]